MRLTARLLTAVLLMLAVTPAWTIPNDEGFPAPRSDYAQAIPDFSPLVVRHESRYRAIASNLATPEVKVFPVWVAGPVVAAADPRLLNALAQASEASLIAVIYPDIAEPYRRIFTQIIKGIKDKAKGHVADYSVGAHSDIAAINSSLHRQDTRVIIALGRAGMKVASSLNGNFGVVVGGVLASSAAANKNIQINSLSPDPRLLFARLKEMKPSVHRIFTVYDPRQNAWIMRLARDAAKSMGLQLVAYQAEDLHKAIMTYREIFQQADSQHDALWLPQDSTTAEEGTVLPLVLQQSWNHDLVVFSSSFSHVRRGVLFSLYPDNVGLGRHLADSALSYLSSGTNKDSIQPLQEVLMAVNVRTAKHLGIDVSRQADINLSFPEE